MVEEDEFNARQEHFKENITRRNAYVLIRNQSKKTCALAFCDPATKQYIKHDLQRDNPLYTFVFNQSNAALLQRPQSGGFREYLHNADTLPFNVSRDERVLKVAKIAIESLGGKTNISERSKALDLSTTQAELKFLIDNFDQMSNETCLEQAIVMIGGAQRGFAANLWNWWMSRKLDWFNTMNKSFSGPRPELAVDYSNFDFVVVGNILGGTDCCGRPAVGAGVLSLWVAAFWTFAAFLEKFLTSSDTNLSKFKAGLEPVSNQQTLPFDVVYNCITSSV